MIESGYYPPGAEFDPDEIWKPIQGFEGLYEISNYGRVKSIGSYNTCKRGIMNPMVDSDGYLHVRLYNSGISKDRCTNSYNLIYSVGKKIAQYSKNGELIKTFNSIADASREYNIPTTNISKCCKGKRHSAGKYIWKYVR